ncbi:hypothetical protein ACOSQ3_010493 [Xanthoceras sorbifolium]
MVSYGKNGRSGGLGGRRPNPGRNSEVGIGSNRGLNEAVSMKLGNFVAAGGNIGRGKMDKAGGSRFDVLNENLDEILEENDDTNGKAGMNSKKILFDITNKDKSDEASNLRGKKERPRTNKGVVNKDARSLASQRALKVMV